MIARLASSLAVALVVFACADSPPEWTQKDYRYECGMNIQQVESITERQVDKLESARGSYTHVIREDDAVVWLGFENGKLRYYHTTWLIKGRMASVFAGRDICEGRGVLDIPVPRQR